MIPRAICISRLDEEDKVKGTVLNFSLALDIAFVVGVLNVTDSCKPGEEAVRDIIGDIPA